MDSHSLVDERTNDLWEQCVVQPENRSHDVSLRLEVMAVLGQKLLLLTFACQTWYR
jgi:hypothetical protein